MILLKHSHFSFLCESCVKAKCETVFLDEHKLLKDDVEAVSKMREESAVAGNNITDECNSTDGEVSKSDDGEDLRPDDDEDDTMTMKSLSLMKVKILNLTTMRILDPMLIKTNLWSLIPQ